MYDFSHIVGRATQQTIFNAPGIFTVDIPRWASGCSLYIVGAGAGGGGGCSNTSALAKCGGGGGGGGGRILSVLPTKMLLNASLQITVGAGGAGGATGATGAAAANGQGGGASTVSIMWGAVIAGLGAGNSGGVGVGGSTTAGGTAGAVGNSTVPALHTIAYANNASASAGGAGGAATGAAGGNNTGGITQGGGGGGSCSTALTNFAGGNAVSNFTTLLPSLTGGVAGGATPGPDGSVIWTPFPFSIAGAGGGTNHSGTAGNGGNGGFGGGGGGGGAGITGGSGGRGGNGLVIVGFW